MIAMGLIDDPSILFLDEPTTGLDSSSSTQCIQLLKNLAQDGKTIVCTIHTPSAIVFEMFNHVYALAGGCCIYQGTSRNLVPFLAELGLNCPETYSPADYLLEIANNDYGPQNNRLCEKIRNGFCKDYRSQKQTKICCDKDHDSSMTSATPSSQLYQLKNLLHRYFLTNFRDKTLSCMRLVIHFIVAIFIGIMYNNIGNDATHFINIYKFLFFNIFLLMFTGFSSLQTSCK